MHRQTFEVPVDLLQRFARSRLPGIAVMEFPAARIHQGDAELGDPTFGWQAGAETEKR